MVKFKIDREEEIRFFIPAKDYIGFVRENKIRAEYSVYIKQKWLPNPDSKDYTIRIRDTETLIPTPSHKYEHTVKHKRGKSVSFEVTTNLKEQEFGLVDKLYEDIPFSEKRRTYIQIREFPYNDYDVVADFPADKPDLVIVEIEKTNNKDRAPIPIPDWLAPYKQ